MNDPTPKFDENPPPGRYGRMTVLPDAEAADLTPEELTWPVATPGRRVRSHFLADTTIPCQLTPEELTWPVVDTGSEVLTPTGEVLSPGAETGVQRLTHELAALLERTSPAERPAVLRRLLSLVSAELPAA